jgi:hypothetical protein
MRELCFVGKVNSRTPGVVEETHGNGKPTRNELWNHLLNATLEDANFRNLIGTIRPCHSYTISRTGLPDTIVRFRNGDGHSIMIFWG